MTTETRCGIWPGRRVLVAVLHGTATKPPVRVANTDDGREGLVAYLVAAGFTEVVVPEPLREDRLLTVARESGLVVWITPRCVLEPLRRAAGISTKPPAQSAAMLARLPGVPIYRGQMRRLAANPTTQLALF